MCNVIEITDKTHKKSAKIDPRLYSYKVLTLLNELNAHFWHNYEKASYIIEQGDADSFDEMIDDATTVISKNLEILTEFEMYGRLEEEYANRSHIMKNVEFIYDTDVKMLCQWLLDIGIPYKSAKVLDYKRK